MGRATSGQRRKKAKPATPQRLACSLPLACALGLAAFGWLPAAGLLVAWTLALLAARRSFALEISLRRQHWLQACAQGAVFLYWGWYWPRVYEFAPLIVAQLLFAYAFEALLTWSRRAPCVLGFGLFPV